MLDVRAGHHPGVLAVVRYHYGNGGVVEPYAVNQVLELVVAQEGFGGDRHKSADVVLWDCTGEKNVKR